MLLSSRSAPVVASPVLSDNPVADPSSQSLADRLAELSKSGDPVVHKEYREVCSSIALLGRRSICHFRAGHADGEHQRGGAVRSSRGHGDRIAGWRQRPDHHQLAGRLCDPHWYPVHALSLRLHRPRHPFPCTFAAGKFPDFCPFARISE